MEEAKHTPGSWHVDDPGVSDRYRYVFGADRLICRITIHNETSEANARLIAAAPDLLDSLKVLLKILPSATTHPAIAKARAAIKQATGQ